MNKINIEELEKWIKKNTQISSYDSGAEEYLYYIDKNRFVKFIDSKKSLPEPCCANCRYNFMARTGSEIDKCQLGLWELEPPRKDYFCYYWRKEE